MEKIFTLICLSILYSISSNALMNLESEQKVFSKLKEFYENASDPIELGDFFSNTRYQSIGHVESDNDEVTIYSNYRVVFLQTRYYKTIVEPAVPARGPLFPAIPENKIRTLSGVGLKAFMYPLKASKEIDYGKLKNKALNVEFIGPEIENSCIDLDLSINTHYLEVHPTEIYFHASSSGVEKNNIPDRLKSKCDELLPYHQQGYFRKHGDYIIQKHLSYSKTKNKMIESYRYYWK